MYLSFEGIKVADDLRAQFDKIRETKPVRWKTVFNSEDELISCLKEIPIISCDEAYLGKYYNGYGHINVFAYTLQHGKALSAKQLKQAKRLSSEIKIAYEIRNYWVRKD